MLNMYVDGEWRTDTYELSDDEDGEFDRSETTFRDELGSDRFPAESGRYHLYVSRACPWAHGVAMVRSLRGLEDEISMDIVDPYRGERGWQFTPEKDDCTVDSLAGNDYLGETYLDADPNYTGRVTVPVCWDRETETIVNNESIELMRQLSTAFEGNGVDLYPEGLRGEIDAVVDDIYDPINNGVYRAGFAGTQEAYETAVGELFDALDEYDERLADRRYLVGDRLTLADLRLFATLVRFDNVYHTIPTTLSEDYRGVDDPKPEKWNRLRDYEHLLNYTRDIYQTDGIAETVNMDHICEHYASPGSPELHTHDPDDIDLGLDEPHGRERLSARDPLDA
ncbi:glutathione-dependent reductase [Halobacteriales archaeon SW_8_65_20]|nr:MAG: glutathione-dependent reductase [Halobacteriales archaeon SW_8_65_20]